MRNFNKKGFTLIEMLIVVVIIGILASALIPRLTSVKDKANDTARKVAIQSLITSMTSYALDNGAVNIATGDTVTSGKVLSALIAGGLKSIPLDPSNLSKTIFGVNTTGYVYMAIMKGGYTTGSFLIIGRAETAAAANAVECNANGDLSGSVDADTLKLCTSVNMKPGNPCSFSACTADNGSQLRMVVKY
ncbi:MAG: type II secretion system protein [Candidatus Absconditabacteria bacterium]